MGRSFENRKASIAKTAGQKTKLYSKYSKQIYVAAKNGTADLETNPTLRALVDKAKREQVPAHVIDKAIEKAASSGGEDFSAARYEGFGPGGSSFIIDCLTDNNNRTITDVRNCFTKTNSKFGATGSVSHLFDHLAVFSFAGENEDEVLEAMLEADVDVDDVQCKDGKITLFAAATEFFKAKTALQETYPDVKFEVDEITFLPQTTTDISEEDLPMFEKFVGMLNECEDVQDIYHNAILPASN